MAKKKKRETKADRYKRVIRQRRIFVLSIFIILVVLLVCLFTPIFGIAEITVVGNDVLSAEEIITTSGIEQGENVFRINKKKAEKALSELAYIEGVQIKRKFPARIQIEIDEAKPDIIINTPDEFLVSTIKGRLLEKTDDVTQLSSPLVFGIKVTWSEVAHKVVTADEELLDMHLENIATFYHTEHWKNIDSFDVSELSNFMLTLKTGMKVTFGTIDSTEGLLRKIKMMSTILPQIEQTERSYLDLTTDKGYYGQYSWAELEKIREEEALRREQEENEEASKEEENKPLDEIKDEQEKETEEEQSSKEEADEEAVQEEEVDERKKASKSQKPAENTADDSDAESGDAEETSAAESNSTEGTAASESNGTNETSAKSDSEQQNESESAE